MGARNLRTGAGETIQGASTPHTVGLAAAINKKLGTIEVCHNGIILKIVTRTGSNNIINVRTRIAMDEAV
eukprot:9609807-Heterocapsa_arctica.AAC.1